MNAMFPSRIYLLRHAKAAWTRAGERDFDRPLSDDGYRQAGLVADRALRQHYHPERIISSSAVRCRQTAELVGRKLATGCPITYCADLYNASVDVYLSVISASNRAGSLMLIGHNPTIEETLVALAGADQTLAIIPAGYPTAGFAVLDAPFARDGPYWNLADFLTAQGS